MNENIKIMTYLGLIRSTIAIMSGCLLIILSSQVKVPFYPVPFTLQTVAIFTLGLTQSPRYALGSVLAYLVAASVGLPVFGNHANPHWLMGKCGGYLVGFPMAAYVTSYLAERTSVLVALICGHLPIYFFGFIWLSVFFGATEAWVHGVLFFIPLDILKAAIAFGVAAFWKKGLAKWRIHE